MVHCLVSWATTAISLQDTCRLPDCLLTVVPTSDECPWSLPSSPSDSDSNLLVRETDFLADVWQTILIIAVTKKGSIVT